MPRYVHIGNFAEIDLQFLGILCFEANLDTFKSPFANLNFCSK